MIDFTDETQPGTTNCHNGACHQDLYRNVDCAPIRTGKDILTVESHPSSHLESKAPLKETYPDKFGEQLLMIFEFGSGTKVLRRYWAPRRYRGETRSDLYWRFDWNGARVCLNSWNSKLPEMYVTET